MARPIKQGLGYFPLDTDFFSDRKVRRILNAHGSNTASILICLLCNIYKDKGYYIEFDEDLPFDIADVVGVSEGAVIEVIKKALQVDFFDLSLYEKYHILTSRGIQRRFYSCTLKRRDIKINPAFWVIDVKNPVIDGNLPEETELSPSKSTQKESKVKENNSPVSPPLPGGPVATAPAASEQPAYPGINGGHDKPFSESEPADNAGRGDHSEPPGGTGWRKDYETYLGLVRQALDAIRGDPALLARQQAYYPGVDIPLSLQKACDNFWATPAGWEHKKKSRAKEIDMKMTLINAISKNRVFNNGTEQKQAKRYDNGDFLR